MPRRRFPPHTPLYAGAETTMELRSIAASFDRIRERSEATAVSYGATDEKSDMTSGMATRESSGATDAIYAAIVEISHPIAGTEGVT